ncbi:MAG: hypothetical protein A2Y12_02375 [Planctomycetes bacterium GWF2_42_9]|nr:MAG: hypothetical protein A2Y12_02375 [Planctomycetes bacterium GWF2_42_9]
MPRDKKGNLLLGDNMEFWTKPFTPNIVIKAFLYLLKDWEKGINILDDAIAIDNKNDRLKQEKTLALHIALSIRSTTNIIRFSDIMRKIQKTKNELTVSTLYQDAKNIMRDEIAIAQQDRRLLMMDKQLGYHPEAFCNLYTINDIDHKIKTMRSELKMILSNFKFER